MNTRHLFAGLATAIGLICFLSFLGRYGHMLELVMPHGGDDLGYYQFLPAVFITHDLHAMPWIHILENGEHLSLFTIGVAVLQLPFFLLAHAFCSLGLADANGSSWPYAIARGAAGAVYAAAGCWLLLRIVQDRYGTWNAVIAVTVLFGATNLYYYAAHEPGMSHVYSFFLFAALLHSTLRMITVPNGRGLFLLMVISAFILLVRPANAFVLLVPVLYGASGIAEVRERLRCPFRFPKAFAAGAGVALALWLPQLLYWRSVTGDWFVFTYGKKGEAFDWLHPHLWDVLTHAWNGWFVYAPIMVAVMGALVWMTVRGITGARTILLVWLISWYVIAAWWSWWLGGAFGHRGFVEHMALLVVPTAWLVQHVRTTPRAVRIAAATVAVVAIYFSVGLSWSYLSPWDGDAWTMESVVREYRLLIP